jgi:hypothetical protein
VPHIIVPSPAYGVEQLRPDSDLLERPAATEFGPSAFKLPGCLGAGHGTSGLGPGLE